MEFTFGFGKSSSERFWQPLRVETTNEDGSKRTVSFDVQYKRIKRRLATDMIRANKDMDDGDLLFLRDVVTDWRKVPDANGAEVPFSTEALEAFYDIGMGPALVKGFFDGLPQAKQKN